MSELRTMMAGDKPVCAPLVLNPLMAKLAEQAGFSALYLGGGASGYMKVHLEANLTLTEMVQAGIDIRTVSTLPLILDAAAGWGDPMHIERTMAMTEAAGFAAIEIEDQILPKRAHHHVGIEHMVPVDLMTAKLRQAVAVRRDPGTVIIGRSNGIRSSTMDDALCRGEAYREAGADVVLLSPRTPDEARHVGERLAGPLMLLLPPVGLAHFDMTMTDMHDLGYRILVVPTTPLLAAYEAVRSVYAELADGFAIRNRSADHWAVLQDDLHETIDLERLLDIERNTVEPPP